MNVIKLKQEYQGIIVTFSKERKICFVNFQWQVELKHFLNYLASGAPLTEVKEI